MEQSVTSDDKLYFLHGGGEMGRLIRSKDWSETPLGPPETWPPALRTTLGIIVHSAFPMFLWWGAELLCFYNDAYRPSLGENGKHPSILGEPAEKAWAEIWHIIKPMIDGVVATGKAVWSEDQLVPIFRNGKVEDVYWTFSYSPVYDDMGRTSGVLVTCTETTKTKKALDDLKESEDRFRTMAEGTDMLISVSDADLHMTYFNRAWSDFTGRPLEEIMGHGWEKLMDPDDKENFRKIHRDSLAKKKSIEAEFRILDKNGEYRWLLAKIPARFTRDGTHTGYVCSCIDITEIKNAESALQKSEQQMRSMVETAPFAIGVYIGEEMRVEFANHTIMDIWGKGYDVIGKSFHDVLPELDNQEVFKQLDEVYATGVPFHVKNQRLDLIVDGKIRPYYFNYSLTPLCDNTGKVYGVMNTGVDLTDLNLAKQQIEQSERNLRNIILQSPVAMCLMLGPDHMVEVANEMMVRLWGKSRAAVVGKPVFVGLPDARGQGLEELLANVYQTGEAFRANEWPVLLIRNGIYETVYQNFSYEAYKDGDGQVLGVIAVAIDVTEQVLARRKIEEAEAKARLAIDSAELGVYEIIYATDEMTADQRFNEIWGVDTVLPRSGYIAVLHPDDLHDREVAHAAALLSGQLDYQSRLIWKDKSVHWVRVTGKVIYDDQKNPVKLIGVAQEITDTVLADQKIRESEKNLRNMIRHAPVAMSIFRGPNHIVELANERMFEFWGKPSESVTNLPIFVGLPEAKNQGFEAILDGVYNTGKAFAAQAVPVTLPRNGGVETVYVNFVYEAYREGGGDISGILAVAIDVTAQVVAHQKIEEEVAKRTKELADANNSLQKSNAELAQFAYIASHDLQEPLRKINTFSQMLGNKLSATLDEQSKGFLDKINSASSRMNTLIRDVLSYSELVNEADLSKPVDLNEIAKSVVTDFELLIEQKEATIQYGKLPVIQAIPLQMSQLFSNLIGNSLKFSRKDVKPVIKIAVAELSEEDKANPLLSPDLDYIKLQFSDNGIGFKDEYRDQIFKIFQRLHRKSEYEGTGIGLAMCKKITLNHHGDLNAIGSTENGAVFNAILPVRQ